MKMTTTPLAGLMIFEPKRFQDERGYFFEAFHQQNYSAYGLPLFLQDNISRSKRGVLRGLHYQLPFSQGKLVGVTRGEVWDVAIDIRLSSPTFGQWFGLILNEENAKQLYIPPGFAHGFCVLSDVADFYYKCTDFYTPSAEHGIAWNDKELNLPWPISTPILSPKDACYPLLNEIPHDQLFT